MNRKPSFAVIAVLTTIGAIALFEVFSWKLKAEVPPATLTFSQFTGITGPTSLALMCGTARPTTYITNYDPHRPHPARAAKGVQP